MFCYQVVALFVNVSWVSLFDVMTARSNFLFVPRKVFMVYCRLSCQTEFSIVILNVFNKSIDRISAWSWILWIRFKVFRAVSFIINTVSKSKNITYIFSFIFCYIVLYIVLSWTWIILT